MKMLARQHLEHVLEPSDVEVAEWIEQIAAGLKRGVTQWNRFLSDVAVVFENRRVAALQGRMILLDDNLNLRRTGPWPLAELSSSEPTVFIPPLASSLGSKADEDDADLSTVPKNLQPASRSSTGVSQSDPGPGAPRRTPVGELLRRLVWSSRSSSHRSLAILSGCSRAESLTRRTVRHCRGSTRKRASRSNVADLHELALRVPTLDGWIPADQAVFSEGWGTRRGPSLARLIETSGQVAPSIHAVGNRALLAPDTWPFRIKDLESLRGFSSVVE